MSGQHVNCSDQTIAVKKITKNKKTNEKWFFLEENDKIRFHLVFQVKVSILSSSSSKKVWIQNEWIINRYNSKNALEKFCGQKKEWMKKMWNEISKYQKIIAKRNNVNALEKFNQGHSRYFPSIYET